MNIQGSQDLPRMLTFYWIKVMGPIIGASLAFLIFHTNYIVDFFCVFFWFIDGIM
jgi:hypothetical protein